MGVLTEIHMECDNMTDFRVNDIGDEKKGIKVYYKIHKSVMSMNKVRYVVG